MRRPDLKNRTESDIESKQRAAPQSLEIIDHLHLLPLPSSLASPAAFIFLTIAAGDPPQLYSKKATAVSSETEGGGGAVQACFTTILPYLHLFPRRNTVLFPCRRQDQLLPEEAPPDGVTPSSHPLLRHPRSLNRGYSVERWGELRSLGLHCRWSFRDTVSELSIGPSPPAISFISVSLLCSLKHHSHHRLSFLTTTASPSELRVEFEELRINPEHHSTSAVISGKSMSFPASNFQIPASAQILM